MRRSLVGVGLGLVVTVVTACGSTVQREPLAGGPGTGPDSGALDLAAGGLSGPPGSGAQGAGGTGAPGDSPESRPGAVPAGGAGGASSAGAGRPAGGVGGTAAA